MQSNKPSPDDLLEIPGWEGYLNYVRGDRHTRRSTLSQVNLNIVETLDLFDGLTHAEAGAFTRLLLEYARHPLRDDAEDARGPRRMTRAMAVRCLSAGTANAQRLLASLEQKGCVRFVPEVSRLEVEYEIEFENEVDSEVEFESEVASDGKVGVEENHGLEGEGGALDRPPSTTNGHDRGPVDVNEFLRSAPTLSEKEAEQKERDHEAKTRRDYAAWERDAAKIPF
jgi:hypothetical protein